MTASLHFNLQSLEHTKQELMSFEQKLADLAKLDVEKAKAELADAVTHLRSEVTRLESLIPARILGHISEGVHPAVALQLNAAGVPTKAEQEAAETTKN